MSDLRLHKHRKSTLPFGSVGVLLLLLLVVTGCAVAGQPAAPVTTGQGTQRATPPAAAPTKVTGSDQGKANGAGPGGLAIPTPLPGDRFQTISLGRLPAEALTTLTLIAHNGPFPYSQDGVVFQNREGLLPRHADGYYHEYTVKTPGASDRGARRIIRGEPGELFYTDDHYASFKRIVP